mmetsp:Transcript_50658/g.131701  ORF Transcript_50658/g.131701 Transcript_50658/m.131701 type:complete len:229 (-) Transcript_50658:202-888(-)
MHLSRERKRAASAHRLNSPYSSSLEALSVMKSESHSWTRSPKPHSESLQADSSADPQSEPRSDPSHAREPRSRPQCVLPPLASSSPEPAALQRQSLLAARSPQGADLVGHASAADNTVPAMLVSASLALRTWCLGASRKRRLSASTGGPRLPALQHPASRWHHELKLLEVPLPPPRGANRHSPKSSAYLSPSSAFTRSCQCTRMCRSRLPTCHLSGSKPSATSRQWSW